MEKTEIRRKSYVVNKIDSKSGTVWLNISGKFPTSFTFDEVEFLDFNRMFAYLK
jgi:hypothetical protein